MLKLFSLFFLVGLFVSNTSASSLNSSSIEGRVFGFLEQEFKKEISLSELSVDFITEGVDTLLALYHTESYFVVCSYNEPYEILAFSFDNGIADKDSKQQELFFKALSYGKGDKDSDEISSKSMSVLQNVTPFIQAMFGQTNCRNEQGTRIDVSNIYAPNKVAVGCVAISLVTVLHHYQWPKSGIGEKTYTDVWGILNGEHYASFEETYYRWGRIKDEYNYQVSSTDERNALAELAYQSAIALEMDFEATGSTSSISKIPDVMYQHFMHYGEYFTNTSDTFFDHIDSMMTKNSPVVLAISGNGYAHSIICDGLKTTESGKKYYHLNMGWWGTSNGWYQISSDFNAGGYSKIDAGVFNLVPTCSLKAEKQDEHILLSWDTSDSIRFSGFELQVKIGRQKWATIDNIETDSTYRVETDFTSTYAFRIRMKYNDFTDLEAWSNIVLVDNDMSGISQSSVSELKLYPNPVEDILNVESLGCEREKLISVCNVSGEIIQKVIFCGEQTQINTSELNSGIYLLKVSGDDIHTYHKFIKL